MPYGVLSQGGSSSRSSPDWFQRSFFCVDGGYAWAGLRVLMVRPVLSRLERSPTLTHKPMNAGHTPRVFSEHLDVPDETVEVWLQNARAGDNDALAKLRSWAYLTAREYFATSLRRERLLSRQDVEDMASGFFVEFDRDWPRVQSATRYVRFLLANWVARYVKRKRERRSREIVPDWVEDIVSEDSQRPWRTWDDTSWHRYRAVLTTIANCDPVTRHVIAGRVADPPRPYRDLSVELQATETALRMRMARFYRSVRRAYERSHEYGGPGLRELPGLSDVIREPSNGKCIDGSTAQGI